MIKLILLLTFILCISLGVSWLAEEPGLVSVDWGVYHLEASVLTLIAAIAAVALVCVCLYWLVFSLVRSPYLWSQARVAKRQSLGITALTETFAAIASQDLRGARRYLKRAESLLPEQPLTLMLASQVARLEGNDSKSQLYLERMSKTGVTEFLALRGLIENARRAGEFDVAIRNAEKAHGMKPQDHWIAATLIGLYASAGRTQDALTLLERSARKRVLQSDELHQMRPAILCAEARALYNKKEVESAKAMLREAIRRHARFVPVITQLATLYLEESDASMALKVAGDGWKRVAHPEIATVLLQCYEKAKDKPKAAKVLKKLAKAQPEQEESQVLMAGLAVKEGDNESARAIVKKLMQQSGETARYCLLLANIEHISENHDQEAYWHRRANECPSGAVWNCSSCQRPADNWEYACPQCGTLGGLV